MKKIISVIILLCLLISPTLFGQVGIGTTVPDPSAVLDLQSVNQGLLLPRVTTTQQKYINEPASGLVIYNLDSNDIYFYNGLYWLSTRNLTDTIKKWSCGNQITDIDGNVYNTVLIGTHCWMKENLKTTKDADGNPISRYCYNNDPSNCNVYGGLYTWTTAMNGAASSNDVPSGVQGICPDGWHLPSDAEWTALTDYVSSQSGFWCGGNSNYIGKSLAAQTNWQSSTNTCAVGNNLTVNNATGFSGLPGGHRNSNGNFEYVGYYGAWWTSTEVNDNDAWDRCLDCSTPEVTPNYCYKAFGFLVRCLRDY